jgi:indoleamine 2,3-dioxygenase
MLTPLDSFEVNGERGFLPTPDPLDCLPEEFSPWEEIGRNLPKLLLTGKIRHFAQQLPLLDAARLGDDRERKRAMVILSFLGHAYVWGEDTIVESLPPSLAVPWHRLALMLGRPPVLSYASYALDNWRRIDRKNPIDLGNIALLQNFLGGQDEEWFVLIHGAIEAAAAPALAAIAAAQQVAANEEPKRVADQLAVIVKEDVESYRGQPQKFRGETGAQSSIIPALDAGLGVTHAEDTLRSYLIEMRDSMPPGHRAFIALLESGPSLREFVSRHGATQPTLREVYNAALDQLCRFRSTHLEYARSYIVKQSRGDARNPNAIGTGGTPFVPYLTRHRNETKSYRIV